MPPLYRSGPHYGGTIPRDFPWMVQMAGVPFQKREPHKHMLNQLPKLGLRIEFALLDKDPSSAARDPKVRLNITALDSILIFCYYDVGLVLYISTWVKWGVIIGSGFGFCPFISYSCRIACSWWVRIALAATQAGYG